MVVSRIAGFFFCFYAIVDSNIGLDLREFMFMFVFVFDLPFPASLTQKMCIM